MATQRLKYFEGMFIHFDRIHERDGWTHVHRMTAKAALDASIRVAKSIIISADKTSDCVLHNSDAICGPPCLHLPHRRPQLLAQ